VTTFRMIFCGPFVIFAASTSQEVEEEAVVAVVSFVRRDAGRVILTQTRPPVALGYALNGIATILRALASRVREPTPSSRSLRITVRQSFFACTWLL
jgi:hypothetical protein